MSIFSDIMLDLETMGTGPSAAIIAIGAIEFNAEAGELGRTFYEVIDLESSVGTGGVIDADTVLWWLAQSEPARQELTRTDRAHILSALPRFSAWLRGAGESVRIWGNGSAFDNVILAEAYRRVGLPVPWDFRNDRCYRTIKAHYPHIPFARIGVHHNALDDARTQAEHLIAIAAATAGKEQP